MDFLKSFSNEFFLALGVWPIASFVLTLPILAFLYNRDRKLRFWSVAGAYLSVLYGLGLVFFTLWPLPSGDSGPGITYGIEPQLNPLGFIRDIQEDGLKAVFQVCANIAFFIPLGFIFKRGMRFNIALSMVFAFAVSLLIETAQLTGLFGIYPYSYRTFDVCDLVWNTSGALVGWCCAYISMKLLPPKVDEEATVEDHPGFVHRCVALFLDFVIVFAVWLAVSLAVASCAYLLGYRGDSLVSMSNGFAFAMVAASFVAVEIVIPWCNDGKTPGAMFVHMTIESRERDASDRAAFYAARALLILLCIAFIPYVFGMVLIYYAIRRKMPYDEI